MGHWTWSDQLEVLDIVVKNLRRNGIAGGDVREVNWVTESSSYLSSSSLSPSASRVEGEERPDIIICSDCIYNPSLSPLLAQTISHLAKPSTLVLIASELRDPDPLEEFLRSFKACGWVVCRAGGMEGEIGRGCFVVWVAWRDDSLVV